MPIRRKHRRLWDTYVFPGFRPQSIVHGIFGDWKARVIKLKRRSKKRFVAFAAASPWVGTIDAGGWCATCHADSCASTRRSKCDMSIVAGAAA
jgi:hypothetical protein